MHVYLNLEKAKCNRDVRMLSQHQSCEKFKFVLSSFILVVLIDNIISIVMKFRN